jgi:hypothetical protein
MTSAICLSLASHRIVGQKDMSTLTLAMSFAPAFVKSWCSSSFFAQVILQGDECVQTEVPTFPTQNTTPDTSEGEAIPVDEVLLCLIPSYVPTTLL